MVEVVEVVGLVVWMVVRLVTVGTKGAVGGAVTSSEDNEEVSFSTPDRIWTYLISNYDPATSIIDVLRL